MMRAEQAHPTTDQLDAFGRGEVPEPEASALEDHIASCPSCGDILKNLAEADPLFEVLRRIRREAGGEASTVLEGPAGDPAATSIEGGGYEVLGPLGRGGMGVVSLAIQPGLGRTVALKQIRAGLDADAEELARFRTEAEAAARLRHPNIVQVYDVGLRDGLPYLAMELVSGGTLEGRLRDGPLAPREAATLVAAIARAVQHAHDEGVLHRDLKPGNILLTAEGTPKVADFGLAKRLDVDQHQTRTGALLGTPSYMAPEQADGQAVGPLADVYSLGTILYECLTGHPPFRGASALETLEQVRAGDPIPPRRLRPGIPADLQTCCLKCLEREPRRRYATAADLADDIDRLLRDEPIRARAVSAPERLLKWARRRPSRAALGALGIVGVVASFAGLLAHQARLRVEIDRADRSAREARDQRALADANYREARDAIRKVLGRLDDPSFADIPRLTEVRRAQTEDALAFYDRILSTAESPDPVVRLDGVRAAVEAANYQMTIGRESQAGPMLRRALQLIEGLRRERPDDLDVLLERITVLGKLGFYSISRDPARSFEYLEEAVAGIEAYPAAGGPGAGINETLAWCEQNLGTQHFLKGDRSEAERHLRRAADLRRAALMAEPGDRGIRVGLAMSLVNLALIESHDRPEQAEASNAEAQALLEAVLGDGDDRPTVRSTLAAVLTNWGAQAQARREFDVALDRLARGLEVIRPLLNREPGHMQGRFNARNLHGTRGNLLECLGRHAEAVEDREQVVAYNDDPAKDVAYRIMLAASLLKCGRAREASEQGHSLARALGSHRSRRRTATTSPASCRLLRGRAEGTPTAGLSRTRCRGGGLLPRPGRRCRVLQGPRQPRPRPNRPRARRDPRTRRRPSPARRTRGPLIPSRVRIAPGRNPKGPRA
ncbi:MAG: serine/threonine-protein kinase [Isosphaeraceae bacterium]